MVDDDRISMKPKDIRSPVRVMLVDDSAVVRGLMSRALREDMAINIVASASNGQEAIDLCKTNELDVVILDIEMPVMDGLTALPVLLKLQPKMKVMMASTLTQRNADISMKAMRMGAADYIPKPTTTASDPGAVESFYRELRDKVKALGGVSLKTEKAVLKMQESPVTEAQKVTKDYALRKPTYQGAISALVIASSTGGPKALLELFKGLQSRIHNIPVFVTQHMPPTFTTMLAQHINQDTGCRCVEAQQGMKVEAGQIYLAPGDFHMIVRKAVGGIVIELNQDPPVNFCRPAADPLMQSAAKVYAEQCLGVVLTGMGVDGLQGARSIIQAGGTMLVQDEASSVVWGMPGAVAKDGIASGIIPLSQMASEISHYIGRAPYAT